MADKRILKARDIERLENTSLATPGGGAVDVDVLTTPTITTVTVTTALATSKWLCDEHPATGVVQYTDGATCGNNVVTCGQGPDHSCAYNSCADCSCSCTGIGVCCVYTITH